MLRVSVTFLSGLFLLVGCNARRISTADKVRASALNRQGLQQIEEGHDLLACSTFRSAATADPEVAAYANNVGMCQLKTGATTETVEWFDRAITLSPNEGLYYINKGNALLVLSENKNARKTFEQCTDKAPAYAECWYRSGLQQFQDRDAERAEKSWLAAQKIKDSAKIETALGLLHMNQAQLDQAEKEFLRAKSLDPKHQPAAYNLGVLYQRKKNFGAAETEYVLALKLAPEDITASFNLALVQEALGKKKDAIATLKTCLPKIPASMPNVRATTQRKLKELGAL